MFILIDTLNEKEYEPPYDSRDTGGYRSVVRTKVTEFKTEQDLLKHLDSNKISLGNTRRVFQAEELVIKTTVTVELVKH